MASSAVPTRQLSYSRARDQFAYFTAADHGDANMAFMENAGGSQVRSHGIISFPAARLVRKIAAHRAYNSRAFASLVPGKAFRYRHLSSPQPATLPVTPTNATARLRQSTCGPSQAKPP